MCGVCVHVWVCAVCAVCACVVCVEIQDLHDDHYGFTVRPSHFVHYRERDKRELSAPRSVNTRYVYPLCVYTTGDQRPG